jgi:hypothetical protein
VWLVLRQYYENDPFRIAKHKKADIKREFSNRLASPGIVLARIRK